LAELETADGGGPHFEPLEPRTGLKEDSVPSSLPSGEVSETGAEVDECAPA